VNILELDTPALAVDLDVLDRNLAAMADYARTHGLRLRPHTKTHKAPWIAQEQMRLGAVGLTVAKPTEAEVMLEAEPEDLLVAYPTFGAEKMARLKRVAERTSLSVSLDSYEAALELSEAGVKAKVLVEFDAGLGRVGIDAAALPALVERIARLPHIEYDGLAFYPGHIKAGGEEAATKIEALGDLVEGAVAAVSKIGLAPRVVSGGSTPSWPQSHLVRGMNEIRPGTYAFNDRNTVMSGICGVEDCAAVMVATVVSTARPGQILIDGGSKTFSSDRLNGDPGVSFGLLLDAPEAHFHKMNEEHGFVDVSRCGREFRVGEKLRVLMNHVCVAMNLAERVHGHRSGAVEKSWEVKGRGKLQ
jgi:D-serine deaminase-like pyridoxal phosphate-dependent protein